MLLGCSNRSQKLLSYFQAYIIGYSKCFNVQLLSEGGIAVVKISERKQREVININDGRRLGVVYDVEIDMEKGTVEAIVIPGTGRVLGLFSRESDVVVGWDNIKKIGTDVILIDGGSY